MKRRASVVRRVGVHRAGLWLLLASGHAAFGCAETAVTAGPGQSGPTPSAGVESPGPAVPITSSAKSVAAADKWNAPVAGAAAVAARLAPIYGGVNRAARSAKVSAPRFDPALARVAQSLAQSPRMGTPSYALVEYWMRYHGLIEPVPLIVSLDAQQRGDAPADGSGDPPLAAAGARLAEDLAGAIGKSRYTHVGVGHLGRHVVVLLLQRRLFTEPIPRWLPLGGHFDLAGRLQSGFRDPKFFVTAPDGTAATLPVEGSATSFRARLNCARGPGRYRMEVSGSDRYGSTIIALFALDCGQLAAEASPPTDAVEAAVTSPPDAEEAILRLVDHDRARFRLKPLTMDPRLVQVARAHSREMVQAGYVGHISPVTGAPANRLRRAGLNAGVVRENLARALGPGEAEHGLMDSPGHRANILAKDVTHIGIGVALGEAVGTRRELFVTQVFARFGAGVDLASAPAELLRELTLRRQRAGRVPLTSDPELETLARTYARGMASGNREAGQAAQLTLRGGLSKLASRIQSAQALFVATTDVESALDSPLLMDPKITLLGLAVVEAVHPTGAPVAGVAILIARGR